jgi:2-oxoglutarate ferredoxin oxidoreductase subunit alpha
MVAMNAETYARDHAAWPRRLPDLRLHLAAQPAVQSRLTSRARRTAVARLCNENFKGVRGILMKNIMLRGRACRAAGHGHAGDQAAAQSSSSRPRSRLLDANQKAIDLGYAYARENFSCPLPLRTVEKMDQTRGHIMIDGNTTSALGCVYAGATVGAWYPITPSTSMMDNFKSFCDKCARIRKPASEFRIIQAEDELSAIGMVLGAAGTARGHSRDERPRHLADERVPRLSDTSREIPAVLFDVQRCGPSTGMPTRTQQCRPDVLRLCIAWRHGMSAVSGQSGRGFYHAVQAFDLAERLQTPVMVLIDLDIGMNDWMCRDLQWDDAYQPDRGKVLTAEQIAALPKFNRYLDTDGDGIAARTLPGTHAKGAYFTRGSGHNMYGAYTEDAGEYKAVVDRLLVKFETAKKLVPPAEIHASDKSRLGFITIGSSDNAVKEARAVLADAGVNINYLRVKGFPFGKEVQDYIDSHDRIYVVEQNRDAQLRSMLLLETRVDPNKLVPVLHYDGLPILAATVIDGVNQDLARGKAA